MVINPQVVGTIVGVARVGFGSFAGPGKRLHLLRDGSLCSEPLCASLLAGLAEGSLLARERRPDGDFGVQVGAPKSVALLMQLRAHLLRMDLRRHGNSRSRANVGSHTQPCTCSTQHKG